jgi:hypothetical protein
MTFTKKDMSKFHVSSDESDGKSSEDNVLILEILKSRIDKEVVEDLNTNLFKRSSRKRKVCDDSEDSDFVEGKKKRQIKQDLKLAKKTSVKKS